MKSINLGNLDVTVICDKSGSMGQETDTPSGANRWDWAKESIQFLVTEIGKHDDDGIDLIFFNASHKLQEKVDAATFPSIWAQHSPGGSTMLAAPLKTALDLSLKRKGEKNQLILVLTDGQPGDEAEVSKTIIDATKQMDKDEQVAILFLQVGKDKGATAFLAKLDDGLEAKGAKFDIVDSDLLENVAGKPLQDVVDKAFND